MIDRAKQSLQTSNILQREALQQMHVSNGKLSIFVVVIFALYIFILFMKYIELKENLKGQEQKVEHIKNRILEAGIRTNNISSILQNLGSSNARKLALESILLAQRLSDEMSEEADKARSLRDDIYRLREKFAILEPDWEIKLGMAEENISSTKTNVRLANISLSFVEEKTLKDHAVFEEWNNTIGNQLQGIRDKIAKARHAAEGVSFA